MSQLDTRKLRELFRYFPGIGAFMRIKAVGNSWRQQPGYIPTGKGFGGYPCIVIEGKKYSCHRLAWLYTYGEWPALDVDHINGDISDFRISNLRDVSHAENIQNVTKPRSDNTSGYLGVSWCSMTKSWTASITAHGKRIRVSGFADPKDAYAKYVSLKKIHHSTSIL